MNLLASPWFWGFCGAFIYAGPKFSACLFSREPGASCARCTVDAVFSMTIGPIAAGAFTGEAQGLLHTTEHLSAISAVIGLTANRVAPSAIEVFTEGILRRLRLLSDGGKP